MARWIRVVFPGLSMFAAQAVHCGVLLARSEAELARMRGRADVRPATNDTIAGTPEQVTEHLLAAIEQGARGVIVHFCDAPRLEGTRAFAEEVVPHLVRA